MKVNIDKRTAKTALIGILTAQALAFSFLESMIPPIPGLPPGAKPGFSNIITMFAAESISLPCALGITAAKALFAFITRGFSAALMSFCGGILSTFVMYFLLRTKKSPFGFSGIGIICACAHNLGQLIAAAFLMGTAATFGYAPVMLVFAVITGLVTGSIFKILLPVLKKQKRFFLK